MTAQPPRSNDASFARFGVEPTAFMWATGIEDTFVPQIRRRGERVLDEYALTQHYRYWRSDLRLATDLGVKAIRYGIPWYKVNPAPGVFDWQWVDQVLNYAVHDCGLTLLIDLMHYGTPLWLDNEFLNQRYPQAVASYARAFAERYGNLVHYYTPLNEPLINSQFCGEWGIWPPYLRGDDGFIHLMLALSRGIIATVEAIRDVDPDAEMVHVEAATLYETDDPQVQEHVRLRNEQGFLATDLVLGRVDQEHPLAGWLQQHGVGRTTLRSFREHAVQLDVLGLNYYPTLSVHALRATARGAVRTSVDGGQAGLERLLQTWHARYGLPLFLSETSVNGSAAARTAWLDASISSVVRLRAAGVPILGYTWWPLFDLVDWIYRAPSPVEDFLASVGGPYDINRLHASLQTLNWHQLDELPFEAFLARMGLYGLELQFDGELARVATTAVQRYQEHIQAGPQVLGPVQVVDHRVPRTLVTS